MGLLEKIFGNYSDKEIKKIMPIIKKINDLEPSISPLTDEELKAKTPEFKERLANGETLDDLLPEAFAVVREAAKRVLGMRHFDVQLIGGVVLHQGRIAEMRTGEGKTLVSTCPAYLNALTGNGVHIVTVNDYLAKRDAEWMGKVHEFLGLKVGVILNDMEKPARQEAYACDITYATNNELGFDYLRDNMVVYEKDMVQRGLNFAIIDEVDSVLIDEARTPLIISGQSDKSTKLYELADGFVKSLKKGRLLNEDEALNPLIREELKEEGDFVVDEKLKTCTLTQQGVEKAERFFAIDNLSDPQNMEIQHHINNALKANNTMALDKDYVVKDGEIVIVDTFTGRMMPGRRYSDGLHQAIEAKEGVPIKEETETRATITYQNFFRLFNKLAGMTGTAKTEEEEFMMIYNMRVIEIPTNKPVIRDDRNDKIYSTKTNKFKALCAEVVARHSYGQPILIGTVSVETSETLSKMLDRRGIRHNTLNAKNHAKEAEIIARAGQMGAVTIATNMAGRGTDIKLGKGVAEIGGLAVIGSERHESRRIDNQLRGRSGRQGDPGYSVFYVSFDDELMQRFAGEKLQSFSSYLDDDMAIENKMVSRAIENAQKRVEGQNFDSRKHILEYDDVMRQQREIMYKERDEIMSLDNLDDIIKGMFNQAIEMTIKQYIIDDKHGTIDVDGVLDFVAKNYMLLATMDAKNKDVVKNDPTKLLETLTEICFSQYQMRLNKDIEHEKILNYERSILLGVIDYTWINHIDAMTKLRNGIYLRAYAQKNPLSEYTEEAFYMFEQMKLSIVDMISKNIVHMGIRPGSAAEKNIPSLQLEVEFK